MGAGVDILISYTQVQRRVGIYRFQSVIEVSVLGLLIEEVPELEFLEVVDNTPSTFKTQMICTQR